MEQQQIDKIIKLYSLRRPLKEISRQTNISPDKIKQFLMENKLWTGHRFLKSYYDEFFFDHIDTEEKAYWLGFIFADGYLLKSSSTIGIELEEKDKPHLEKFRQALKAEREVKIYHKNSTFGPQTNCRFSIGSKHLHEMLLSYFKTVDKTHEGVLPQLYQEELVRHCIRGLFDGDGCLSGRFNSKNELITPSLSLTGTKETLLYVEEKSGFKWNWSQRFPERDINNYSIGCGRINDCLNFLDYMYKDATVYLDRKYDRYKQVLKNRHLLDESQSR